MKISVLFENDSPLCAFTDAEEAMRAEKKLRKHYEGPQDPSYGVRRAIFAYLREIELDPKKVKPSFT